MQMLRSCGRRMLSFRWPAGAVGHSLKRSLNTSVPPITAVEKIIIDGIKATGPISFSTYMQMCLSHPTEGYYMNPKNPIFGSKGDFVTSPEISSLFGELLGVWLMSQWMQSSKQPIRIIELGPGRGTLMHDVMRVVAQFGKTALAAVHLVETSPALRALQDSRLAPSALKYGCTLEWHDSADQIPPSSEEYTMVIAHEFFDALPFHTVEKTEQGWQEILIALAEPEAAKELSTSPEAEGGQAPASEVVKEIGTTLLEKESAPAVSQSQYPRFRYVLSPQPTAASTLLGLSSTRFRDMRVGARLEVSPLAFRTMRTIGELVCGTPDPTPDPSPARGCGLIVDYGAAHVSGQSFRAFQKHQIVDVFHAPGECDLTANVDFTYLAESVADLVPTHGPIPQSAFLEGMGLQMRLDAAVSRSTSDEANAVREAGRRLVDPTGMGREYMVLGVGGHAGAGGVWPFIASHEV
ncbi:S-adenosyl-L-methionine-dependent methyltransferase [Mycena rosella]|uniref:Protein arginine methyltransferase NDUFAF7 n=1 Tax=Mycena rosella TaxID=1033263 RepID=A0AAD7GXI8_MYCRO|nr:S-adenosyl-L-methionine-dependent methyltransferase [Mycena rosella]